jgi:hypothetical protein
MDSSIFPNSRVGKFVYFNLTEVEAWLASGRRKTIREIEEEGDRYIHVDRFYKRRLDW